MSTLTKFLLGGLFLLIFTAVVLFSSVVGLNNQFVGLEQGLKAQYSQNQNNYDNYVKKLKEAAQVPDMYASDLEKVYKTAISGRYGKDGSKAVFQFLQEHNPSLDSSIYVKIQQIIESGRNSFEADQKMLLDKKRVYETNLNVFPSNVVAKVLGFPKIDLSKIDIVTSVETDEAFTTKKAPAVKVRE